MNLTRIPAARLASRAVFFRFALALLAAAPAALLAACDKPSERGADPSAPLAPTEAPARVTHILIAFKSSRIPHITRSKEDALALAKSVIDDITSGRRTMEELMEALTDDRPVPEGQPPGKPNQGGVYTVMRESDYVPAFKKAVFDTPVGKITPEPVEAPYGYHIIRRDR